MERFNLKKLSEVEGKEQYRVEISSRLAVLGNLDTEVDVNKTWETIRENIKICAKESPYATAVVTCGLQTRSLTSLYSLLLLWQHIWHLRLVDSANRWRFFMLRLSYNHGLLIDNIHRESDDKVVDE
jgi:hypothetical protein